MRVVLFEILVYTHRCRRRQSSRCMIRAGMRVLLFSAERLLIVQDGEGVACGRRMSALRQARVVDVPEGRDVVMASLLG